MCFGMGTSTIRAISGVMLLAVASMASADEPAYKENGERVSIINLIATPERYDGKLVFLSAYATVKFEGDSLCMTQQPASTSDCLWLQFDDGPYETEQDQQRYLRAKAAWQKHHGKHISVRGIFSRKNTGHFGLYSGAIEKIVDVYPELPPPKVSLPAKRVKKGNP